MADNFTVLNSASQTVTFRSTDIGLGIQGMMSIPANTSGTALIGQQVAANSIAVVLASNQSSLTAVVTGTVTAVLSNPITAVVSGTVTAIISGGAGTTNVNLSQVGGSTFALGQAVMATSIPVAIASNQSAVPISGTVTAIISGGAGTTNVNLTQVGGTTFGLGQAIMATSLPVAIASNQSAIPITGTVTAIISGGAGTTNVNLSQVGGSTFGLGQAVMATSLPVAIASNQSAIPITGTVTAIISGGAGTTNVNLSQVGGSTFALGQAIMATSLPVAIASNQSAIPITGTVTAIISGGAGTTNVNLTQVGGSTFALGQAIMATSLPVAIASNQSAIPITGTVTAIISGGAGTTNVNITQVGGTAIGIGQAVMASSFPVVIASNQSSLTAVVSGTVTAVLNNPITAVVSGTITAVASGIHSVSITQINGTTINIGQAIMATSIPVAIASNQSNVPFNLVQLNGTNLTIGQQVMTASIPVVLASNQSAITAVVSGTVTAALANPITAVVSGTVTAVLSNPITAVVSGTVTAIISGGAGTTNVNLTQVGGSTFGLGQAIMATSIPVAIASNQSNVPFNLVQFNGTALTIGQQVMTASIPVVLASNQSSITAVVSGTVTAVASGTHSCSITQINGTTINIGQAVMATSIPVVIASNQSSLTAVVSGTVTAVLNNPITAVVSGTVTAVVSGTVTGIVSGDIASGAADSGNPVKLGAVAHTAAPTAVSEGQRVNVIADKVGKLIAVGAIRQLMATQTTSLTTAAETTIINPINATTFADLYGLVLANTGATTSRIDLRYGLGSAIVMSFEVPSLDTRGFMVPVDSAIPCSLTTANVSWTVKLTATTNLTVTALYVKNI